ncbi:MAG: phosphoglycerate mutase family protein [Desulfobacteraceae bacterium]|jgi:hypothetical protein
MDNLIEVSKKMQQQAWSIIEEIGVIQHWTSIGATINLVGSLKTGLLINNRDIDFHIYTSPFSLSDSFLAISKLAENNQIAEISYKNLIEEEDKCIEWHASYTDRQGIAWKIDMIHILKESPFSGYFENVANRISDVLTNETREAILRIKSAIPEDKKVMSIQVYQAVIEDGIRDIESFWLWEKQNLNEGIVRWIP